MSGSDVRPTIAHPPDDPDARSPSGSAGLEPDGAAHSDRTDDTTVRRTTYDVPDDSRQLVDGPRPAADWVRLLRAAWTTPRERLVLLLLALDTYAKEPPFTCAPTLVELAESAGEYKGRISEAIASLATGSEVRPALLEVTRGTGRRRTTYRLMVENGPALWSGTADHYGDETEIRSGPLSRTTKPVENVRSGPASGPLSRTTPLSLTTYDSPKYATTGRAHENCQHKRSTVDGDCLACGHQIFSEEP